MSLVTVRSRRRADGTRTVIVKVAGDEVFRGVQLRLPVGRTRPVARPTGMAAAILDGTYDSSLTGSPPTSGRNPTADQLPLA